MVAASRKFDLERVEEVTRFVEQSYWPARRASSIPLFVEFWTAVLGAATVDRGCEYLVDSSKSLVQFRRRRAALAQLGLDVRVVRTSRPAADVVRSSRSGPGDTLGERWTPRLSGSRGLVGLFVSTVQAKLDANASNYSTTVALADLLADEGAVILRVAAELGISAAPELGPLRVGHAVGGNRSRHSGSVR